MSSWLIVPSQPGVDPFDVEQHEREMSALGLLALPFIIGIMASGIWFATWAAKGMITAITTL